MGGLCVRVSLEKWFCLHIPQCVSSNTECTYCRVWWDHSWINLLGGLGQKFAVGLSIDTPSPHHTYHHLCLVDPDSSKFPFNTALLWTTTGSRPLNCRPHFLFISAFQICLMSCSLMSFSEKFIYKNNDVLICIFLQTLNLFFKLFSLKTAARWCQKLLYTTRAVRMNQNNKVGGQTSKQWAEAQYKAV